METAKSESALNIFDDWHKNNAKKKEEAEKKRKAKLQSLQIPAYPLPTADPGFVPFCRWNSYPEYGGLYQWQEEYYHEIGEEDCQLVMVHRDGGKSILFSDICQYRMWYKNYDVLYLGWTDRRKQVASYVHSFFQIHGKLKDDKSEYHFTIEGNGKFDCYLTSSKETLGMHSFGKQERFTNLTPKQIEEFKNLFKTNTPEDGVLTEEILREYLEGRNPNRKLMIVIDDAIDDTFFKERFKEVDLERRFASTIYNINPDAWLITGTHKFEGDFYFFLKAFFKDKIKSFYRGPYLIESQKRYNADLINNPLNITTPERFTHPNQPNYKEDIQKGKKDLLEIQNSLARVGQLYWWFAEYCNQPHPITGEEWKALEFIYGLEDPVSRNYDMVIISVDRATTTNIKTSAHTGCPVWIRNMHTGELILTHDFTGFLTLMEVLLLINDFAPDFKARYEYIPIIVIVEKQGGGDDFEAMARYETHFVKDKQLIPNKIPETCSIVMVHNTGDKITRIKDRMKPWMINSRMKALITLTNCPTVEEINTFPNSAYFDGIDASANVAFKMMEYPITGVDYVDGILNSYREGRIEGEIRAAAAERDISGEPYFKTSGYNRTGGHRQKFLFS